MWIWLCEKKLKGNIAHFRLSSASQKRACLSTLSVIIIDDELIHREPKHVIRDENKCIVIYVCPCVFFSPLEEI